MKPRHGLVVAGWLMLVSLAAAQPVAGPVPTLPGSLPVRAPSPAVPSPGPGPGYAPAHAPQSCSNDSCGCEHGNWFPEGPGGCPIERVSVQGDYLLWWLDEGPVPAAILTRSPPASNGILGEFGTRVRLGRDGLDYGSLPGGRLLARYWLDDEQQIGVEAAGFFLARRHTVLTAESNELGIPVLARPIFNAGDESAILVSFPNQYRGGLTVAGRAEMYGGELGGAGWLTEEDSCFQVGWLGGLRYVGLTERLDIVQQTTRLRSGDPLLPNGLNLDPGAQALISDRFRTTNDFYGAQVGLRTRYIYGFSSFEGVAKLALGCTKQGIDIGGSTGITRAGAARPVNTPGGLLAVASNSGPVRRSAFGVIPELGVQYGYDLACWLRLTVGYTFLYWNDVARPGLLVDRRVNPAQVPASQAFNPPANPARPTVPDGTSDVWAQGLNIGLEFRY